MAEQSRKPKPKKDEEEVEASASTDAEVRDQEIDDLLDEIDEVLEVNSEEFVRSYVQKGGELRALILEKLLPLITTGRLWTRGYVALS